MDIDDLLQESGPAKTPIGGGRGRGRAGRAGPGRGGKNNLSVFDDDFYKNMKVDDLSDVSDADPDAVLKEMDNMDDLDANLFGKKPTPKTSSVAAAKQTPATPASKPAAKKKFDWLDDDPLGDDPLGDLDLDSDDDIKSKKPAAKPVTTKTAASKPDPDVANMEDESPLHRTPSRRLEVERPPTRSGRIDESPAPERQTQAAKPAAKKKDDFLFDDDDDGVLGGMGLESPRQNKPAAAKTAGGDDPRPGGAKSILNDLLGGTSSSARPTTGEHRPTTALDSLLSGSSSNNNKMPEGRRRGPVKKDDEEVNFGSYMPSASSSKPPSSAGARSVSPNRKKVEFDDPSDDLFGDRPKTTPTSRGRRGGPGGSLLQDMIQKDDRDWLDMAAGSDTSSRPRSAPGPQAAAKTPDRQQETRAAEKTGGSSEPMDWLGFSSMGSPAHSPRQPRQKSRFEDSSDDEKPAEKPATTTPAGRGGRSPMTKPADPTPSSPSPPMGRRGRSTSPQPPKDDDDWLGLGSSQTKKSTPAKDDNLDWLGGSTKKDKADDWLGGSLNEKKEEKKKEEKKGDDDWMGLMSSMKKDKKETGKKGDDFLGLGNEVELDSMRAAKPGPAKKPVKTVDDLFKAPAKRETADMPEAKRKPSQGITPAAPSAASSIHDDMDAPPSRNQSSLEAILQQKRSQHKQREADHSSMDQSSSSGFQMDGALDNRPGSSSSVPFNNNLEQMKLQHDQRMKKQSEELQRKMAEQQNAMQMQMQQQMQQQMEAQQQMAAMAAQAPSMGGYGGFGGYGGWMGEDKIGRLEQERDHLKDMLETVRRHHKEQLNLMEEANQKQVSLVEETYGRREERLRQEIEQVTAQSRQNTQHLETDRASLISQHRQAIQELELSHSKQISQLRAQHSEEMERLQQEHNATLMRLRAATNNEVTAVINSSSHAQSLQAVINQVGDRAKDLSELQHQVEVSHSSGMSSREQAAIARDQQLKALQQRLEKQQQDGEVERARLQGLLSTLEMQLTEQTRGMEQEKWRIRQEENKLKSMQESLQKERERQLEQLGIERKELEHTKDNMMKQQSEAARQLHAERRQLEEEKARFHVHGKLQAEQQGQSAIKQYKTESELDATVKVLTEEKLKWKLKSDELERQAAALSKEQAKVEQERYSIKVERQKLEQQAIAQKQLSADIEDMCTSAAQAREEGQEALDASRKIESEHQQRLHNIHCQLAAMREAEKHLAEERLNLAREKQAVETSRNSALCVSCRTPVRDMNPGMMGAASTSGGVTVPVVMHQLEQQQSPGSSSGYGMSPAAQQLYHSLPAEFQNTMVHDLSASIQRDREIRMHRIKSEKDREFLEEEGMYLQAIKHAPYHIQQQQFPTHDK